MKVNKFICLIVTVALAALTSVSDAQTELGTAIPEAVIQDAVSLPMANDGSMVVSEEIIPAQPAYETGPEVYSSEATGSGYYEPAPVMQACDCCEESCSSCRPKRQRPACGCKRRGCQGGCEVEATPMFQSCEGDFCKLSTKTEKVKKSCFKTEQVPVCLPAVRLPWQKCCPPSKSRTRLVTKLKTEKTEVESCVYKWSVEEANDCGCDSAAEAAPAEAASEPAKAKASDVKSDVEATIEEGVVPPAPEVKGAFLRSFRKR